MGKESDTYIFCEMTELAVAKFTFQYAVRKSLCWFLIE